MKFQTFIFALTFIFASQVSNAQCGSHKKNNRNISWNHHSDLVDIVSGSNDFSTLTVALKTAGLVKTLQSEGPFTVFAPSNSAFAKLPDGTVESLLKPGSKDKLTKILTYHVIAGEFNAKDIINGIKSSNGKFEVETVSGDRLIASLQGDTVLLTDENGNKSAVLKTDLNASNGIAHVIDSVVLPN